MSHGEVKPIEGCERIRIDRGTGRIRAFARAEKTKPFVCATEPGDDRRKAAMGVNLQVQEYLHPGLAQFATNPE